mmetsp:Transcript_66690/g.214855  ORF Transcript_66690/g.214855 Transcript_66690/m.214855 type:complete len:143 (+) Transcript_66690:132-560(+)
MQPQKRRRPLAILAALGVVAATVSMVQRCFAVSTTHKAAPVLSTPRASAGEGGELLSGMPLAGIQVEGRDVKVVMYNKKRGRRDRSPGWTNRKKFRQCSFMSRQATVKGRKIIKRQRARGKKVLGPGDYINPKMQPIVHLTR